GARFELGRGALAHDVAAVAMRNRDLERVALVVQTGKRGARGLDTHPGGPRQKLEPRVPHQPARQEPRLAQDLKPVADAEDRPAGARVRGDGAHDRREPGDRARAKVIAVAEAPRQDHDVGVPQVGVAVPHVVRVRARLPRGRAWVEQRGTRHDANLDTVAAHDAVPPPGGERPRVRGPKASPIDPPSVITIGPAISASSSSEASRKKPRTVARNTPYAM